MKIGCPCGATIRDNTDNLPHKAHLIPDQEWFATFDAIDGAIDDVIAGRTNRDAVYMAVRRILGGAKRFVYQCRNCGRLFIDDRQRQLRPFVPVSDDVPKEILRSRDGDDWDA